MSVRLPQKTGPAAPTRNEGTWLAMVMVFAVTGGFLFLISMVFPDIMGVVTLLAAFGGFVALHYFTWGRWLSKWAASQPRDPHEQKADPAPQLNRIIQIDDELDE